jgi:hypothetical protein
MQFKVGDKVVKKSGKPFKNGEKNQTIFSLGKNEQHPNNKDCAVFSDGSVCNLQMLKLEE